MEERIKYLEKQVKSLQQAILQFGKNSVIQIEHTDTAYYKVPQVDNNTNGVQENDMAICDVAMLSDENGSAIEELAEIVDELLVRVEALEEK